MRLALPVVVLAALGSASAGAPESAAWVVQAHAAMARTLVWSSDGKSLVTAGFDGTVAVRDARSGALRFALTGLGERAHWAAVSRDAKSIAACGNDGTVAVWSAADGKLRWKERQRGP